VDADLVVYLFTTVLDGRNTPLADGVQRAMGRPPREFSDYVRRTAATGLRFMLDRTILILTFTCNRQRVVGGIFYAFSSP
jgi:hypothetical protein